LCTCINRFRSCINLCEAGAVSSPPPWPLSADPFAAAFAAGQEVYKAGLLSLINGRRQVLGKRAMDWPQVGATPHEVLFTDGGARLLRYRGAAGAERPPVLLVCSLINKPYVLDLLPERSVVRRLGEAGLDVWLLDWGAPRPADASRGLAEYALELLPRAASVVARTTGEAKPHLLGYCMGGTLALLAIAAGRLSARSLIALATPVRFDDEGLLSRWCRTPGFEPAALAERYGNVPPHLLQPAFKLLDPVGLATKLVHLAEKVGDDPFVRFFLAMETWLEDSVAFPGRAFVEWVDLYRSNALARGKLQLASGSPRIELARVRCPVLSVVAERDYITPPSSSAPLADLVGGPHELIQLEGGHIGLSTGGQAHRLLWPRVAAWLLTHSHHKMKQTHKIRPRATRQRKVRR
jgi:polyhydroxyalkanoate synthase